MRSVILSLVAALLLACSGGGTAQLEIEIAPTPSSSDPDGEAACGATTEALPRTVECVSVRACERTADGDCDDVPVLRPEDDHGGAGRTTLFFSRMASATVTFDVRLEPGRSYDLEIVAYQADGTPYARGRALGVRQGSSPIRVRLEPFGAWSCAGPAASGGAPLSRALHQAVTLDTGDVLLIGGVTGDSVPATSIDSGAALQRTIEVYDASESRFHPVTASDTDGEPGYGGVFHRAFYLGRAADGRHRVRVVGGFAASGDDPAARFDAVQGLNYFNAPILPGARAEVRDSIDLLYDDATRSATIVSVEPGPVPRAGFDAVSEPDDDGLAVVVLGLENSGGATLRPRPVLSGSWYALPVEGFGGAESMPLIAPRFGATASRLSAGQVLVWGGNVDALVIDDVIAQAGEVLGSASGPVSAATPGFPASTALHTATPVAGGVILAGGLVVEPVAGMSGGITTATPAQPLSAITLDAMSRPQSTAIAIDATLWPTPILHGAVALEDGSVLISGGAVRRDVMGMSTQLWPIGSVIRVARDGVGVYAASALPGLVVPRWGHAVATLPGGRVLVTGGFDRTGSSLRALAAAEILLLDAPPASIASCGAATGDAGPPRDAGTVRDAAPDPGDAGAMDDAAPADLDAGM